MQSSYQTLWAPPINKQASKVQLAGSFIIIIEQLKKKKEANNGMSYTLPTNMSDNPIYDKSGGPVYDTVVNPNNLRSLKKQDSMLKRKDTPPRDTPPRLPLRVKEYPLRDMKEEEGGGFDVGYVKMAGRHYPRYSPSPSLRSLTFKINTSTCISPPITPTSDKIDDTGTELWQEKTFLCIICCNYNSVLW